MLFLLQSKNTGVKFFESMAILNNARYSHGPSLKHLSLQFSGKYELIREMF
jgi:hypothetical protein